MPGAGTRVLEKTLSHLASTLEQADQAHINSGSSAFLQRVDARVKVIGAVLLTIAAVSSHRLEVVLALLLLLTVAALWSKVSWRRLLAGWAGGIFFAALVAVPAIFTSGWTTAALLVTRSETSLTCWLLLIMTTPFNRVLKALRTLHVPVICIAIFSMTFRYIFLLVDTAQDMLLSRRSRIVGRLSGSANRRMLVSTTGVLLGKTIQMSDDVYQAMTARGFRGDVHLLDDLRITGKDWMLLSFLTIVSVVAFAWGR